MSVVWRSGTERAKRVGRGGELGEGETRGEMREGSERLMEGGD